MLYRRMELKLGITPLHLDRDLADWFSSAWNVLVNPRHPEANLLKITVTYEHAFDTRFS
jgi:hypothetical protein